MTFLLLGFVSSICHELCYRLIAQLVGKETNDARQKWVLINDQPVLVKQPKGGFQVQRKRWVVERTFAWLTRFRRLARDYEGLPTSSEAFIQLATIRSFLKRLAPFPY